MAPGFGEGKSCGTLLPNGDVKIARFFTFEFGGDVHKSRMDGRGRPTLR
jgi:hypothetical protein